MAPSSLAIATLFAATVFSLIPPSHSQSTACTSQTFANRNLYTLCNNLPVLDSYLHWAYDPARSSLSIAFIARAEARGWVSWAINPTATGMVGSQALVAFRDPRGEMTVKTYNITAYGPLTESRVWFNVTNSSAEYSDGFMRLFATVVLPVAGTAVNHVWQVGPSVTDGMPDKHEFQPQNLNAKGRLDLLSGQSTGGSSGSSRTRKRNIHGVLNAVSWGIMFPIGIIIARYLRVFPSADPAWFYLHVFCQIFALLLRPNKDHKIRFYWNIYHHGVGYVILILGIINVFKGLDILQPENKWENAYIVVIAILGGIAVLLEAITWVVVLRRKKPDQSTKPYDGFNNGRL
ncbi:cytochrome b561 and DOMON domain-containing protein at3g25290 [Phtheirospermum japonicum]|uniref:Cytochrome b561 and DOMON domain-containing protein at3g25290 n=1 Tax=Phtheirospermum japonicum TaxID=374723 RepID=A0A830C268_9LAMI|nr:cytochrome b561 and DOMON domain-containing protein at3g25290 [Phtheirospermum japonicum]